MDDAGGSRLQARFRLGRQAGGAALRTGTPGGAGAEWGMQMGLLGTGEPPELHVTQTRQGGDSNTWASNPFVLNLSVQTLKSDLQTSFSP